MEKSYGKLLINWMKNEVGVNMVPAMFKKEPLSLETDTEIFMDEMI